MLFHACSNLITSSFSGPLSVVEMMLPVATPLGAFEEDISFSSARPASSIPVTIYRKYHRDIL
jgi:hypothetical protein